MASDSKHDTVRRPRGAPPAPGELSDAAVDQTGNEDPGSELTEIEHDMNEAARARAKQHAPRPGREP